MSSCDVLENEEVEVQTKVATNTNHKDGVKDLILALLGKPNDLNMVTSRQVGELYYRVNVYCNYIAKGECLDWPDIRITDSFYVGYRDGEIFYCNPPIEKKYNKE